MIFTPPFRLGRASKRYVLDAKGLEVIVFRGDLAEAKAEEIVVLLNFGWNSVKEHRASGITPEQLALKYLTELNM